MCFMYDADHAQQQAKYSRGQIVLVSMQCL